MSPKKKNTQPRLELPAKKTQTIDFVQIGGSPVSGITLRQVLRGHTEPIFQVNWSPDGRYLASSSKDHTVRIWDIEQGVFIHVLEGHKATVISVTWSPDGSYLASSSDDETVIIWSVDSWDQVYTLNQKGGINGIAWSPDGKVLASYSRFGTLQLWDTRSFSLIKTIFNKEREEDREGFREGYRIVWSTDGQEIAIARNPAAYIVSPWLSQSPHKILGDGQQGAYHVIWSPDDNFLASVSTDKTIHIWDRKSGKEIRRVEGHTSALHGTSFSFDGSLLASKAHNDVRVWDTLTWTTLASFPEASFGAIATILAFHPHSHRLATLGENDTIIRIWDMDYETLLANRPSDFLPYTAGKIVLVGDSGVGKTGLGWRLAHGEFKEHSSTHGQQFWVVKELEKKRSDGAQCEGVLWDLAGQQVYRPVHSIFLDDVDAALVLFDPGNREEPLKGTQFWLEQLKGKKQLPPTILVGARVDRGTPVLTRQDIEQFCQRYNISGGYIPTSAKTGEGVELLLEALKAQIPWDSMTTTVTTKTFKRIKDHVLSLKEKPDRKGVLISPADLRRQLEASDPDWTFSDAEMMTATWHLQTHGYVTIINSSKGKEYILLAPDLLASLASSIVLLADKHPRDLGAINENELIQVKFPFEELRGLERAEQHTLLETAIQRFLTHNICFRETLNNETLLIFPGLIKQKRPLEDDRPAVEDISYIVHGRVENIYAMLVVLLGYTPSFTRINQWQNQAQYEMGPGEICGFKQIAEREGEIELVLYYGDKMPEKGRKSFQQLFEQFLYQHQVEVTRFPPVLCRNNHLQQRATVVRRIRESKDFAFCDECGERVTLPSIDRPGFGIGIEASPWLLNEEAAAHLRSSYEIYLAQVKSYRHQWSAPRCYISCVPEQTALRDQLAHDLIDTGVYLLEQPNQVEPRDWVVMLDCLAYQQAFKSKIHTLSEDVKLIKSRLTIPANKRKLISLYLEGQPDPAHEQFGCKIGDFCDDSHYPVGLFNLVLTLYAIPLDHAGFKPLRQALHEQWEQIPKPDQQEPSQSEVVPKTLEINKGKPTFPVLIVTVTKVEAQTVLEVFTGKKDLSRQRIGDKTYYDLGTHGGSPVMMVQSEMGTANPAGSLLTVNRAIQDLHPQSIIMCGIAFGLRKGKQELGDILVARQLMYYESQKVDIEKGTIPRGDRVMVSEALLDQFRSGDIDWQGAKTHFGLVLSGEKLVNDPSFREWLLKTEPEAVGGEMEGAGLYAAARAARVDWILIKGICDWADGTKSDNVQSLAAHNAAEFVKHVLETRE